MSPHWGVRALLIGGVIRSGEEEGLRQTWRGCSSQREGRVQGPREMSKGVRTGRQESRVRMRGVRAETEQEEPGVTLSNRGRGRRED